MSQGRNTLGRHGSSPVSWAEWEGAGGRLWTGLEIVPVSLHAPLFVEFSDEAAETVAWDELLAVQLEARRWRGVVVLEPLLDGAAL
eukprot:scaffold10663_cov56-Phaeocystis_antarctica.AAC.1